MNTPVDIVHISSRDPRSQGSYNRFIGRQLRFVQEWNQSVICKSNRESTDHIITVASPPDFLNRYSYLPSRFVRLVNHGIEDAKVAHFASAVTRQLSELKPKVVIAYDLYKMGAFLKKTIRWPCRMILAQRGFSYNLSQRDFKRYVGLSSFDVVWLQTRAAYHYDRHRVHAYEPAIEVIPNSVDTQFFKPCTEDQKIQSKLELGLQPHHLLCLLFSRQVAKKGAHIVASGWSRIASRNPDVRLLIAGSGDDAYVSYLMTLIPEAYKAGVIQMGRVDEIQTRKIFQTSDIYLFPTLAAEGMANTLLEALACALPAVASGSSGPRELYEGCSAVRLVDDANDPEAFALAIESIIQSREEIPVLGRRGRVFIEENFSDEVVMARISDFYGRQIEMVS